MKFLNYLQEEYTTSVLVYGLPVQVYVNPSKQELQKIIKDIYNNVVSLAGPDVNLNINTPESLTRFLKLYNYIRYAADMKNQKLYVWAGCLAIHHNIVPHLPPGSFIQDESPVSDNSKLSMFKLSKYSTILTKYPNVSWLKSYFNKIVEAAD